MYFKRSLPLFTLFTSGSTLLCCALPALFVSLGAGATFAGLIAQFPQLVWLSEHKVTLFIISGVFLMAGGVLQWRARFEACPIDPELRDLCQRSRTMSLAIYGVSLIIYCVGFFFAYLIQWVS